MYEFQRLKKNTNLQEIKDPAGKKKNMYVSMDSAEFKDSIN